MDSGANRASGSNVLIPCVRTATSPETPARDGGQKSRGMVNTASLLTSNTDQRRPTGTQPEGSGNLRHSVTQTRGGRGTWDLQGCRPERSRDLRPSGTQTRVGRGTWDLQGHRPERSGDLRPTGTQTRGGQGTWGPQGHRPEGRSGDLRPSGTQTRGGWGHRPEGVRGPETTGTQIRGFGGPETHRDTDQRRSGDLRPLGTQIRGGQGTWDPQGHRPEELKGRGGSREQGPWDLHIHWLRAAGGVLGPCSPPANRRPQLVCWKGNEQEQTLYGQITDCSWRDDSRGPSSFLNIQGRSCKQEKPLKRGAAKSGRE